jgi:hypothetical protein
VAKQKVDTKELKRLHEKGLDDSSIAASLGVPLASTRYYRNKLGLSPNKSDVKAIDVDKFKKLYAEGANDAKLSREMDISTWRVRQLRAKLGYKIQSDKCIDYAHMRELYDAGCTDLSISRQLGVCSVTVGKWRKLNNLPIVNTQYKHMIEARNKNYEQFKKDEIKHNGCVTNDSESLYGNTKFLEQLMNRKICD